MRTLYLLIFALMLSLNTAYAATAGVCDELKHGAHVGHFGHHEHGGDVVDEQMMPDGDEGTSHQYHTHLHPNILYLLPNVVNFIPQQARSTLTVDAMNSFDSAPQARLDQPPIS